jgi:hypothetical protein
MGHTLLFITMFYELYKNHKTTKGKKSGRNFGYLKEVIHNYGVFRQLLLSRYDDTYL